PRPARRARMAAATSSCTSRTRPTPGPSAAPAPRCRRGLESKASRHGDYVDHVVAERDVRIAALVQCAQLESQAARRTPGERRRGAAHVVDARAGEAQRLGRIAEIL